MARWMMSFGTKQCRLTDVPANGCASADSRSTLTGRRKDKMLKTLLAETDMAWLHVLA
jgi:hypothetical protein